MRFEWDPNKEKINKKQHGLSFKEAQEALTCGLVVAIKEDHDHDELRYVFLGKACRRYGTLTCTSNKSKKLAEEVLLC